MNPDDSIALDKDNGRRDELLVSSLEFTLSYIGRYATRFARGLDGGLGGSSVLPALLDWVDAGG